MVKVRVAASTLGTLIRSFLRRNLQLSSLSRGSSNIATLSMSLTQSMIVRTAPSRSNPGAMGLLSTETRRMRFGQRRSCRGQTSTEGRQRLISASEGSLASPLLDVIQVRSDNLPSIGLITGAHTLDPPAAHLSSRTRKAAGDTMRRMRSMRSITMRRSAGTSDHGLIPTESEGPIPNPPEDDMYPQPHQLIINNNYPHPRHPPTHPPVQHFFNSPTHHLLQSPQSRLDGDSLIMKQSDITINLVEMEESLSKSELTLKFAVKKYQHLHNQLAVRAKIGYDNNQHLLSAFVKITATSFKPIELILRFLEDADILNLAATCQSLFRFIYSPLGYRVIRSLRPVVIKVRKEREIAAFNKVYLQNLCSEVNLVGLDEDDRAAIIQTMRTNLMAARQKMKEIQKANSEWDKKKTGLKEQIGRTISKREELQRRIDQIHDQLQKLNELLQQSSDNIKRLKQEQQKMQLQRLNKKRDLQTERDKLNHQKDLLIKKIKSQQKEREEGLIYAREVSRVTAMLNKLTAKK